MSAKVEGQWRRVSKSKDGQSMVKDILVDRHWSESARDDECGVYHVIASYERCHVSATECGA